MSKAELIKSAIQALLPEGAIWVPATDEELDQLLEAMSENWLEAYNSAFGLGDVRDSLKTQLLEELEREFGFLLNPALSEETRRQQITAVKYENTDQRNSDDDVQAFLNSAGFDVQVHHNDPAVDPALFAGDILANGAISQQFPEYIMQCGGDVAFCGHQDAVCGRFDTFSLVTFEYDLPIDPQVWPFIYFIGGTAVRDGNGFLTAIAPAEMPLNRKSKFTELILSAKPWMDWAILIIDYTIQASDIPGLKFDLNAANYQESITKDVENRISEFRDDSRQNNHAFQGVLAAQAKLILNAINGHPGVRFDGVDDFFDLTNVWPNTTGDFTFYVVLRLPNPITSSPEILPGQVICSAQNLSTEPRGVLNLGNVTAILSGETLTVVGVENTSPFEVSFGYLNTDIAAGIWVIKVKLIGSTLTIALNGVAQTINLFNVPGGAFGIDRTFKNMDRIGAHVTGEDGFLDADWGRSLYWDRGLTVSEDDKITDLLMDFWLP